MRTAASGAHSPSRSGKSPSFGILRPSRLTCGQSEPHTMRSAACWTNSRASGVTDG
jgi:hypothetical protein